ncbi:unnamed protein product [Prorocentrum cordatum]|uniref:Protein kinase domain-containing protein n=1 Tax=Prorocentrum cordatum TaxID=2364126 RepID=A0ABN9SZ13_9DINO|nr:unnamed protein product [Polarella glacialis]
MLAAPLSPGPPGRHAGPPSSPGGAKAGAGLSSLADTLAKLSRDERRHEDLVGSLARRMAARGDETVHLYRRHKQKAFADSGYVMVKTLGQGRHGMLKLARRKGSKARVGGKARDDLVAVRLIQRFALQRDIKAKEEMLSTRESHATLLKHVHVLRQLDHPNIQKELETFEDRQQIFIVCWSSTPAGSSWTGTTSPCRSTGWPGS